MHWQRANPARCPKTLWVRLGSENESLQGESRSISGLITGSGIEDYRQLYLTTARPSRSPVAKCHGLGLGHALMLAYRRHLRLTLTFYAGLGDLQQSRIGSRVGSQFSQSTGLDVVAVGERRLSQRPPNSEGG